MAYKYPFFPFLLPYEGSAHLVRMLSTYCADGIQSYKEGFYLNVKKVIRKVTIVCILTSDISVNEKYLF